MHRSITSKNGVKVFIDLEKGHASTHLADDDTLLVLIKEVVQKSDVCGEEMKFEYVFDHVIGECDLQTVNEADEIVYAVRKHRDRYTKFVKNKPRHQCFSVTIILRKIDNGYDLVSAWIGHLVPSFPKLNASSVQDIAEKDYWQTHALVWGKQAVDETTVTTVCPWETN